MSKKNRNKYRGAADGKDDKRGEDTSPPEVDEQDSETVELAGAGVRQSDVSTTDRIGRTADPLVGVVKAVSTNKVVGKTVGRKFPGPVIVIIFSVDSKTARECAERNGLKSTQWAWLAGAEILQASRSVNVVVWRTGNYYTRKTLHDIEKLIELLNIEYMDAPL